MMDEDPQPIAGVSMSKEPGRTEYSFVDPCLCRVKFLGVLEGPELEDLFDWMAMKVEGLPYFLIEADMSAISGATPEARKLAADRLRSMPDFAISLVGGTFSQRIIAKLVLTAVEMLTRGKTKAGFFKDEESSRAWLYSVIDEKAPGLRTGG
jgi:hypothetical protein